MADLARLKAKIAALRAKTTGAGCTEAEALAAAAIAAKLMAENGIDEAEMAMSEAEAQDPTSLSTWRRELSAVISACTNTAPMMTVRPGEGSTVLFVGRAPGPEIAVYLRDICFRAVAADLAAFQQGLLYRSRRGPARRRQATDHFCEAMARRLAIKLLGLFKPTRNEAARAEATAALDRRFPTVLSRPVSARPLRSSGASQAGWVAGDKVALHHGVGGRAPDALIGREVANA